MRKSNTADRQTEKKSKQAGESRRREGTGGVCRACKRKRKQWLLGGQVKQEIRYAHCLVTRKSPMTWGDTQKFPRESVAVEQGWVGKSDRSHLTLGLHQRRGVGQEG